MAQEDQRLEVGHRRFGDLGHLASKPQRCRPGEVLKGREVVAVLVNGGITTEAKNDVERGFRKGPLDLRYDQDVARFGMLQSGRPGGRAVLRVARAAGLQGLVRAPGGVLRA